MKLKLLLLTLLCFVGIELFAQERTLKKSSELIGKIHDGYIQVPCQEDYTYYEDDNGNYLKHGQYTLVGKDHVSTSSLLLVSYKGIHSYSAKGNYADGLLNGILSISMNIDETETHANGNTKNLKTDHRYTGGYLNGIPNGEWNFTTMQNGITLRSLLFHFSDGKYTGTYKAVYEFVNIQGSFDSQGRLNGTWTDKSLNRNSTTIFKNGVLVSDVKRDNNGNVEKNSVVDKAHADIIALYANGEISEKELEAKSYAVVEFKWRLKDHFDEFFQPNSIHLNIFDGNKWRIANSGASNDHTIIYKQVAKIRIAPEDIFNKYLLTTFSSTMEQDPNITYSDYIIWGSAFDGNLNNMHYIQAIPDKSRPYNENTDKYYLNNSQVERYEKAELFSEAKKNGKSKIESINYKFGNEQKRQKDGTEHIYRVWKIVFDSTNQSDIDQYVSLYKAAGNALRLIMPENYPGAFKESADAINNYDEALEFFVNDDAWKPIIERAKINAKIINATKTDIKTAVDEYNTLLNKSMEEDRKRLGLDEANAMRRVNNIYQSFQCIEKNTDFYNAEQREELIKLAQGLKKFAEHKYNYELNKLAQPGVKDVEFARNFHSDFEATAAKVDAIAETDNVVKKAVAEYNALLKSTYESDWKSMGLDKATGMRDHKNYILQSFQYLAKNTDLTNDKQREQLVDAANGLKLFATHKYKYDLNTMAKPGVDNVEFARDFFAASAITAKSIEVNALYGAGAVPINKMFSDGVTYSKPELMRLFKIALKGLDQKDDADKATLIKLLNQMIKLYPMKTKKAEKAAESIKSYDEALDFLLNKAEGLS